MEELRARDPKLRKPVVIVDQQSAGRESALMEQALDQTLPRWLRPTAPSARPRISPASPSDCNAEARTDQPASRPTPPSATSPIWLWARVAPPCFPEFPELHGVEQELINRCTTDELAARFRDLMQAYAASARAVNSDFAFNPRPAISATGLITRRHQIRRRRAQGGESPISGVLFDYPEYVSAARIHLQCTPGNDVESVTAQWGRGRTIGSFSPPDWHAHRQSHCAGRQNLHPTTALAEP